MSLRRRVFFLFGTAACAAAFLAPAPTPGLGTIESAAPPYFELATGTDRSCVEDGMLSALRQQASVALTQLRGRADGE